MNIAILGCGKKKQRVTCCAKDMYLGPLYKKRLQYCINNYDKCYIISAKYGILELNRIIEPYNTSIKMLNKTQKNEWSVKVASHINLCFAKDTVNFHVSKDYLNNVIPMLNIKYNIFEPVLPLGKLMQFYSKKNNLQLTAKI